VNPFEAPGEWLKCALHAHTTNSDGELAPDKLARHYTRAGYNVLAITDHWVRTDAAADAILVIPSAELNCVLPNERDGHVLAFGIEADPRPLGREYGDLARTGEWIVENGGVAYLAHPYWSGVVPGTLELPDTVAGIEVYNAGCELEVGQGVSSVHWDVLLEAGARCFAIASDDTHYTGFDSDYGWTWVKAAARSRDAVLSALREGSFYASTGPLIRELHITEETVEVCCSPAQSVMLLAGRTKGAAISVGRLGYRHAAQVLERSDEGGVVRVLLDRPANAPFGRVEVVDLAGRKAWTNPV
jgi:hypothetical protein